MKQAIIIATLATLFLYVALAKTEIEIVAEPTPTPERNPKTASWYDYKIVGRWGYTCQRATEDCYTETHLTGASREYPRGSMVEVCRIKTNKCIQVKITDYIEHPERDIDLSSFAFSQLADLSAGLMQVHTKLIE